MFILFKQVYNVSKTANGKRRRKMKVKVTEECIGCGLCASICPQVFEMDGDRSTVVGDGDCCVDAVQEAAAACPVNAIETE